MAYMCYFDSRPKLHHVPIQSVGGNSRASDDRVIDAEAVQFIACE